MLRQRLQANAIRRRMLRERLARPPEPSKKDAEKPPDDSAVVERLPAEP